MKGDSYEAANCKVCKEKISIDEIPVAIKDGIPSSIRDDFEDNQDDYCSLTYEDWCDLLYKIEGKYNRKRAATQIKKIDSARAVYHYDSDKSVRILRKNKARNGVLRNNKGPRNKAPKNPGNARRCML